MPRAPSCLGCLLACLPCFKKTRFKAVQCQQTNTNRSPPTPYVPRPSLHPSERSCPLPQSVHQKQTQISGAVLNDWETIVNESTELPTFNSDPSFPTATSLGTFSEPRTIGSSETQDKSIQNPENELPAHVRPPRRRLRVHDLRTQYAKLESDSPTDRGADSQLYEHDDTDTISPANEIPPSSSTATQLSQWSTLSYTLSH